jgi:hypothetical protein
MGQIKERLVGNFRTSVFFSYAREYFMILKFELQSFKIRIKNAKFQIIKF